jgi:ribosomal protein S18 acetylase RimI-like enzyme
MRSVTIRPATVHDVGKIRACLEEAFEAFRAEYTVGAFEDTVPTESAIRARMTEMTIYAACAVNGEIVGTISCSLDGDQGHLRGMAVNPDWQGQGLADQLLGAAENALREAGCARITLDTTAPLRRAIRFYERHGFHPSGKVIDFFGMPLYEYIKPVHENLLPSV